MIFKEEDKDFDAKKKIEANFEHMRGQSKWDKYIEKFNQERAQRAMESEQNM